MAVDPPTAPPPPSGLRTDSGEHAAADKVTGKIGGASFSFRLSGVAKYLVIPVALAVYPMVVALRAPSRGDVAAEAKKVKDDVAAPVNANADLQAKQQAELARLAAVIQTLEKARQETVAPAPPAAGQPRARRRRPDPETAQKVATATQALNAIQVRTAAAPKPKTIPVEQPKGAAKDAGASPVPAPGVGGSNP